MPYKTVITAPNAPAAIGPYSAGINTGDYVFVSGQIPVDPQTGNMPDGISDQTRQSITNLKAVLEAAGLGLDHVVKTTVFLQSMDDFAKMNAAYAEFFVDECPARSAVEVSRLPKGALVEIEAIAYC